MEEVTKSLKDSEVIPDVLDDFQPQESLEIKYGETAVTIGSELSPENASTTPNVSWKGDPSSYYTLAMVDPDAPSRKNPKNREWCHWIVGNVPGNEINKGEEIIKYMGPSPPEGTGAHRYVFALFKQPGTIDFSEAKKDRPKWNLKEFAKNYGLKHPIAANFFYARTS